MDPTGKPAPEKKKIILLIGLGLGILIIYRQMVLKPAPAPEPAPTQTGAETPAGTETAAPATRPVAGTDVEEFVISESTKPASGEGIGQNWGRDPFVDASGAETGSGPGTTEPVRVNPPKEEDLLELTGIAWYKNKALAVINGQVVHEGEYLYLKGKKTYLVISILKNRVLLKRDEKTITLRVRGG